MCLRAVLELPGGMPGISPALPIGIPGTRTSWRIPARDGTYPRLFPHLWTSPALPSSLGYFNICPRLVPSFVGLLKKNFGLRPKKLIICWVIEIFPANGRNIYSIYIYTYCIYIYIYIYTYIYIYSYMLGWGYDSESWYREASTMRSLDCESDFWIIIFDLWFWLFPYPTAHNF